jgi:hypothetical protein
MVYDGITLLLTHGARCFSNAHLDGLTHQQGEGVRASPLRHSVMRKPEVSLRMPLAFGI